MELATAILGILGRVTEGISEAIRAARAQNEDEAFAILERTLTETGTSITAMRAALAKSKAEAEEALKKKFDVSDEPTQP